jgi:hypothetical protein
VRSVPIPRVVGKKNGDLKVVYPKVSSGDTAVKHLARLNAALGQLSHGGTWLRDDVLQKIWYAKTEEEAVAVAEYARKVFHQRGIEDALWGGDRTRTK